MKVSMLMIAMFAAAPVFANDIDPHGFEQQPFVAAVTQGEVRADLAQAQAQGALSHGEIYAIASADSAASKSRAEVSADLTVARGRGETNYGEGYDPIASATAGALSAGL